VAEELAQETLAKVCSRWGSVQRMTNPEAWMFRVGINLANSYFRRKSAERRMRQRIAADVRVVEQDLADSVAVRDALGALTKRQRSVLVLRFYADLSVHEVAQVLDMPEGTVKTLTHRALKALRQSLDPVELREVPNAG
jgi:RNA polymerase sigma-70 factor (ECF subfamily)